MACCRGVVKWNPGVVPPNNPVNNGINNGRALSLTLSPAAAANETRSLGRGVGGESKVRSSASPAPDLLYVGSPCRYCGTPLVEKAKYKITGWIRSLWCTKCKLES